MSSRSDLLLAITLLVTPSLALAEEEAIAAGVIDEEQFVPLFNGRDLDGWSGDKWSGGGGVWRVEEGAIVGESTPQRPVDRSHYLFWDGGEPADFVFRAEVRLLGGNSGVQFRSKRLPGGDADGYQADYDADKLYVGCLYQPARHIFVTRGVKATIDPRGQRSEERFADPDSLLQGFEPEDWHEYEIDAQGPRIVLRLDGKAMCEVDDRHPEHALRSGVIALQLHQGPPMRVEYRAIRLWDRTAP